MLIIFANGTIQAPIMVTGASKHVQGSVRDVLTFVFPADESMATLDASFSESECETITIKGDDGSESVYKGYTIRTELKKAAVEVQPATADTEAVTEDRITVSIAQRTYAETRLASLTDTVDMLVMESLMEG